MEADELSILGSQDNVFLVVWSTFTSISSIVIRRVMVGTGLSHIRILLQRSLLHKSFSCSHEKVFPVTVLVNGDDSGDSSSGWEPEQINDGCSLAVCLPQVSGIPSPVDVSV